jgi:hypothetical protein
MEGITETRWLVLCPDGRHSTIGRHRDPDEEDIARSEAALKAQGLGGWLVLMKGRYYDGRRKPSLMMVRQLGEPTQAWEGAAAAFEAIRQTAVRPGRSETASPKGQKPEGLLP